MFHCQHGVPFEWQIQTSTRVYIVNLAVGFSSIGKKAGLLDADVFGPSIPRMMNLRGMQAEIDAKSEYAGFAKMPPSWAP